MLQEKEMSTDIAVLEAQTKRMEAQVQVKSEERERAIITLKEMDLQNTKAEIENVRQGDPTILKKFECDKELARAHAEAWTIRFLALCLGVTILGATYIVAVL